MIEYLLYLSLGLLLAIQATRKGRRRRRSGNFFAYPVQVDLALGALAEGATVAGDLTAFGTTRVRVISADLTWTINDGTSGQGPVRFGLTTNDLTVAEVNQKLDARPTSKSDIIAMERSRRPVRDAGKMSIDATGNAILNDGKPKRTKLGFSLDEGKELQAWARNEDSAVLVTGAILHVSGTLYMVWL